MLTWAPRLALLLLAFACTHCSRVYHPEVHPETTYARVYNVPAAGDPAAPVVVTAGAPAQRGCALGSAAACWNECFHEGRGWSCELLSVMFRTGEGVFPDQVVASNLHARACALGQCARRDAGAGPAGQITSPGSVVVYGDVNGNIVIGQ